VLVYGAGALGLTSVAALRLLYPDVEVAVVARFEAQHDMALQSARPRSSRTSPASLSSRRWPSGPVPCSTCPWTVFP